MSTRMLIDARHTEETRVAVVKGNRVEDFDYESSNKVNIKGNIYLAKVTRVEPSLQAAFVEYGGNRHGFLAFSEIHPDYYQIPVEDREALLAAEAALMNDEPDEEEEEDEEAKASENEDKDADEAKDTEKEEDKSENSDEDQPDENIDTNGDISDENNDEDDYEDEELQERLRLRQLRALKRRYKIQEVIKPRQIMLIQVVKEERGNKGAALTSYISLAGRYTVLMPNTTHGGGISRKISNVKDRKRLKSIVESLDIAPGTGCIIRTAGMKRTKVEIKRDVEYIQKIWNNIRDLTLKSVAPCIVYEEGNLIKRAIRDLYDRTISEVIVEGEVGYKMAKEFMTLLMPSHAKRVTHYKDGLPLFQRYQVEEQLDGIFTPEVTLKSGGYVVINPTEALIAIDVNSGKSTKQRNIEATAFKTNLEAAVEIGRQLRLRDLAGLVVIDFIDMEDRSHIRKVENRMKEAVKSDRARIMVGRISSLGLLEISRQRLRPNLEEASTEVCEHCLGTGRIRNKESAALHVLRAIENEGYKGDNSILSVSLNPDVAIYVLNKKRKDLTALENKYGIELELTGNAELISPHYEIQASGPKAVRPKLIETPIGKIDISDDDDDDDQQQTEQSTDTEDKPRRRRRRGGRGRGKYGRNRFHDRDDKQETTDEKSDKPTEEASEKSDTDDNDNNEEKRRPRRRGRRGGRRSRFSPDDNNIEQSTTGDAETAKADADIGKDKAEAKEDTVKKKRAPRKTAKKADDKKPDSAEQSEEKADTKPKPRVKKADDKPSNIEEATTEKKPVKKPASRRKTATSKDKDVKDDKPKTIAKAEKPKAKKAEPKAKADSASEKTPVAATVGAEGGAKPSTEKKKGWWQRK